MAAFRQRHAVRVEQEGAVLRGRAAPLLYRKREPGSELALSPQAQCPNLVGGTGQYIMAGHGPTYVNWPRIQRQALHHVVR